MEFKACTEKPFRIYGLEDVKTGQFWRLPDAESEKVSPEVRDRSKTPCGGRIRFRTNASRMVVRMTLQTLSVDTCIPICGSAGLDVYTGSGMEAKYCGYVSPTAYDMLTQEKEICLQSNYARHFVDVTINLPRNEKLENVEFAFPETDAELLPPTEYSRSGVVCFYGSSITEGGCASRPGNCYTATVARWLDTDYRNFGFSGVARGEEAMARSIAARDFSAFVLDYDHNAPDPAHLQKTHAPFFRIVREAHPTMPILMMSKPDFASEPDVNRLRRDIIYHTYLQARDAGDENVYFLDGETFFDTFGRENCTVDGTHPTDLGFYRMAEKVYRILEKVL